MGPVIHLQPVAVSPEGCPVYAVRLPWERPASVLALIAVVVVVWLFWHP
jgi:hypothetical protein